MAIPVALPDLSMRPYDLRVERTMRATPSVLFRAWTEELDHWIAEPGTMLMKAEANAPYFFETRQPFDVLSREERQPHYGRFLKLARDSLIEMTWVSGPLGTRGAETVVSVELAPSGTGTRLRLTHAGFADEESRDQHQLAWPVVLERLDERTAVGGGNGWLLDALGGRSPRG
jgi:uncharacterized protein YndB with AHSA1/START domain